jgi:hypothetical protein
MSLLLQLLIHEVVQPLIYGMGWLLVFVFTLGKIRPRKGEFYKTPLVGLLGVYAWCALPVALVLSWRALVLS